ncbi:maleylpyruvate isomerase family mycothiol-dependent enzyme [Kitasatospora sp. NPDC094028]
MEISAHIDALRREGALLADAAAGTDLAAPVPTCPDWRLADLLRHIGNVHRWAAAHPARGLLARLDEADAGEVLGPQPADADLLDWYREGHAALLDTLTNAPADVECWTFIPAPSPLAFWARRQAHETAIHRIDADSAAGTAGPEVDSALAADGIDELLRGFLTRDRSTLRSDRPRTVLVRTADSPGAWHLTISPEPLAVTAGGPDTPAELTLTGPAHDLYLLLWNRLPADERSRIAVDGDADLLRLWQETAGV